MTTSASASTAALTIPETARELRVSRRTVYRMIAARKLIATDVSTRGRPRLRVELTSVRQLLANGRLS